MSAYRLLPPTCRDRFPLWSGPTDEWPYPFPPIRGGDGDHKGSPLTDANGEFSEELHDAFHNIDGNERPTEEDGVAAVRGTEQSTLITTENAAEFNNRFPVGATVSFLVNPTTGDRITATNQVNLVSLPDVPEDPPPADPPLPTVDIPGPNVDVGPGAGTPTTTTVNVTGQGYEVRGADGSLTVYPIDEQGRPVLSAGVQVLGPQAQAGAGPVRVTSQIVGNNLITIDPFSGEITNVQALPPEVLSPFQNAQISLDQQQIDNRSDEFAQDFGQRVEEYNNLVRQQAEGIRQGDENLQLLRDQLGEQERSNRAGEALVTRQQIEVERNNLQNNQRDLQQLQLQGKSLVAEVDIARSQISGQNADRILAASESVLNRTFNMVSLATQDEQFRLSQKAQLLDSIAQSAQSPFDVVRQTVLSSQGPTGISSALARGEDAITPEGTQALGGQLNLFQELSRPSNILNSPMAQAALRSGDVNSAPLPQLPNVSGIGTGGVLGAGGGGGGFGTDVRGSPTGSGVPAGQAPTAAQGFAAMVAFNLSQGMTQDGAESTALGDMLAQGTTFAELNADPEVTGAPPRDELGRVEIPALAGGGMTDSSVRVVGENGPELQFDMPDGRTLVLNQQQAAETGLSSLFGTATRAAEGGIFGNLESAALTETDPNAFLQSIRNSLFQRFADQGVPITARTGPVGVSAPGTRRNLLQLAAGAQASAGFNPEDFIDESLRATPPGLSGRARLSRTK